jgi:hypothetical protein
MCVSCLATKTGMESAAALHASLDRIGLVLEIRREHGRCRACGLNTTVLSTVWS